MKINSNFFKVSTSPADALTFTKGATLMSKKITLVYTKVFFFFYKNEKFLCAVSILYSSYLVDLELCVIDFLHNHRITINKLLSMFYVKSTYHIKLGRSTAVSPKQISL